MSRIKITTNFFLDELVNPDLYKRAIEYAKKHSIADEGTELFNASVKSYVLEVQDHRIWTVAQTIRDIHGKPCYINGEYMGKTFVNSGVREPNCTVGAKRSMHKYLLDPTGKIVRRSFAADIKANGMTGDKWMTFVEDNAKELYIAGVTTIEDGSLTPTWLHVDGRPNHKEGYIQVVNLTKITRFIKAL